MPHSSSSAMSIIQDFGNNIAWLSNIVTLSGVGLIAVILLLWEKITNTGKTLVKSQKNIESLINKEKGKWKLAILDDEQEYYPHAYLSNKNSISQITSLPINQYKDLLSYEIALIDFTGVSPDDKRTGGGRIIEKLGAHSDRPVLVAISNNKFDLSNNKYMRSADAEWDKNFENNAEWDDKFASLISEHLNINSLVNEFKIFTNKQSVIHRIKIRNATYDYIQGKLDLAAVEEIIKNKSTSQEAQRIANTIHRIKFFKK